MRLYEIGAETGALFDAGLESGVGALGATGGRAVVAGPITGGPRMDVLANNDMELNDQVLITLMRRYDVNKDGNIAYEDLLRI